MRMDTPVGFLLALLGVVVILGGMWAFNSAVDSFWEYRRYRMVGGALSHMALYMVMWVITANAAVTCPH